MPEKERYLSRSLGCKVEAILRYYEVYPYAFHAVANTHSRTGAFRKYSEVLFSLFNAHTQSGSFLH